MKASFLLCGILIAGFAAGQDSPPPKDESKAPTTDKTSGEGQTLSGMTIIGDKESPLGLYIIPWRNGAANQALDRPARLLEEVATPIDRDTFRREVSYYYLVSDYRKTLPTSTQH
jgi:hypothetical protein